MHASSKLRIIGGRWRRRQIAFTALAGLRPTSDRVRETLFNWLMPVIDGAHCLDAFAGSGALGFEALSRGAASVVMVDTQRDCVRQLQQTAQQLQAEQAYIYQASYSQLPALLAARNVASHGPPFDIVFLDPPFAQPLSISEIAAWLEQHRLLAPAAWIYTERARTRDPWQLAPNWRLHRQASTRQVDYALWQRIS